MASDPIGIYGEIDGDKVEIDGGTVEIHEENVEILTDFIFLGSKIIKDGNYNHEIGRHLLSGRKVMTKLDNILKTQYLTLPTKFHLIKAMFVCLFVFSSSHMRM